MASDLSRICLSRVIEPEYLGINGGYDADPEEDRFGVLFAKKRNGENQFVHFQDNQGNKKDEVYAYMADNVSKDLYILHRPYELPHYFFLISLINPVVTAGSLVFNVALVIGHTAQGIFDVLKGVIIDRNGLKTLIAQRYKEVKQDILWIGKTIQYGLGMQVAAVNGVIQFQNRDELFAMKVAVARIEFLWNRKEDFHESCLTKMIQMGRQVVEALNDTESNALAELIEVTQEMQFSDLFTRTIYMVQCFQSRGHPAITIDEEVMINKFEPVSQFDTYEEYFMDARERDRLLLIALQRREHQEAL